MTFAPTQSAPSDDVCRWSLDVFVMEVDMSAAGKAGCRSCDATLARVREAADMLRPVFGILDVDLNVSELRVSDLTQARALGLRASPMIRIGGFDLYPEHQGRTPDGADWFETDRVWRWNGQTYDQPPTAMLIDALLRAYAQGGRSLRFEPAELPPYVRQFLERRKPAQPASACGCG